MHVNLIVSKRRRGLGRASLAAAALFAVASLSTGARADSMPDAWITTKVKSTLLTTEGVSSAKVHVDTIDGLITLYGSVPTAAEKAKAEQARARRRGDARSAQSTAGRECSDREDRRGQR